MGQEQSETLGSVGRDVGVEALLYQITSLSIKLCKKYVINEEKRTIDK